MNINRQFREVIDVCLNPDPDDRPCIDSLLKYPMFNMAPQDASILKKNRISSSQPPKPKNLILSPTNVKKNNVRRNLNMDKQLNYKKTHDLSTNINVFKTLHFIFFQFVYFFINPQKSLEHLRLSPNQSQTLYPP